MALLKVSEFAIKYNVTRTNLYTYKSRGKIIINEGYIDESNPINKIFIDSRETSFKVKIHPSENKESEIHIPEPTALEKSIISKASEKKVRDATTPKETSIYSDHKRTNKLRDEKLEEEIRLAKLRNDKLEGRLIPVDVIKRSTAEMIARYKMTFLQQTEQLIRDTLNELLAGNEKITATCSKLTDIANDASKRATLETKMAIQNITDDSI